MEPTRLFPIIVLLSLVTVEYGGWALLGFLTGHGALGAFRELFFRAGHAHAGVLLVLSHSCCTCLVRSQISVLCVRASTLIPSTSELSPATARSWWESVRTMSASMCASPESLGHPGHALGQPPLRQHLLGLVHHLHVVIILSPVIAHEQPHPLSRPRCRKQAAASGRTISDLMKLCSPQPEGTTSQQRSILPVTGRGTVFRQGSKPRNQECSPAGGRHTRSLPDGGLPATH
jgi:hypothetical protein